MFSTSGKEISTKEPNQTQNPSLGLELIRGEGSADLPEEGAFAGETGSREVNHQKSVKGKYPESKSKKSIAIDIDTYQQKNLLHPRIQT